MVRRYLKKLHAILVGNDPASATYVEMKEKACKAVGMSSEKHLLPGDVAQSEIEKLITDLNSNETVNGILVQLPLPEHLKKSVIMDLIDPDKDVDGFSSTNIARLYRGEADLPPCTPNGILKLFDYYDIGTEGKNVVVIGRGETSGKPLAYMLSDRYRNATVTMCHSRTKNLSSHTKSADIVVVAVGKPDTLTKDMVKDGVIVVDVGVNRVGDDSEKGYHIVGDVHYDSVYEKASYITPVPGGVGPMTIACLLQNTLKAYFIQQKKK